MTERSMYMSERPKGGGRISLDLICALVWLGLLGYQLVRTMRIDTYELSQSRFDILGYWLVFVLSAFMGARLLKKKRLILFPTMLIFYLIFYITLVRHFTVDNQSPIAFLFSRYGLVLWVVIGIGFASVLNSIREIKEQKIRKIVKLLVILIFSIQGFITLKFSQEIIASPIATQSYQAVASSASIYLLIKICTLIVLWKERIPLLISTLFISYATIVAGAVALLQSTSIVVIWLGLILAIFGVDFKSGKVIEKISAILIIVIGTFVIMQTDLYENIGAATRFSAFINKDIEFSSIISRLDILETFGNQFLISPIFGNFEAEVAAGEGVGYYVHSLPLSFLTHTGLIGTGMVSVVLYSLMKIRVGRTMEKDISESQLVILMCAVLVLGVISTFMTWPVFWFMLGVFCLKPANKYKGG
jgi:hypothetical protein